MTNAADRITTKHCCTWHKKLAAEIKYRVDSEFPLSLIWAALNLCLLVLFSKLTRFSCQKSVEEASLSSLCNETLIYVHWGKN